jgi:nitrogen fixation protein NifU and related proteins
MKNHQSSIINHQSSNTEDPLYREIILEHWQNPQNYGVVKNADFDISDNNPSCGDKIRITGKITNGKLTDIKFTSIGCAISKASSSLFTEQIKEMPISKILKFKDEDVLKNLGVEISPARYPCALLAFKAIQQISK